MNIRATVLVAAALLCLVPVASQAQLGPYSQNFESLNMADPGALSNDGWLVFGNVFDPTHTVYYYGYGPFPAPNPGGGFSAIVNGQGGAAQGIQQLSVYNDYNNTAAHNAGDQVESIVYREQTIGAGDVGKTVGFMFDAKHGNWAGGSTVAAAFIKTLNPAAGYATTNYTTHDLTNAPQTWNSYSITLTITPDLVGQLLQIGFVSTCTHFDPSVVFYDNISFVPNVVTGVKTSSWGQLRRNYR